MGKGFGTAALVVQPLCDYNEGGCQKPLRGAGGIYHGEPTEIPLRNCIPLDALLGAVKEYFVTGRLPTSVEWEAD